MLSYERVAADLRAQIAMFDVDAVFARHARFVRCLKTGRQVLTALDEHPPYSEGRDAVLADLIRLLRRLDGTDRVAVRCAAVYGALPALKHAAWRALPAHPPPSRDEIGDSLVVAFLALHDAIERFDPDGRSQHVVAGLQKDAFSRLHRQHQRATKASNAIAKLAVLHRSGCSSPRGELWVRNPTRHPVICRRHHDRPTGSDVDLGRRALGQLVRRGTLIADEVRLLLAVRLERKTATAVAAELQVDRRTVVRRIERTLRRCGGIIRSEIEEVDARSDEPVPVVGERHHAAGSI